ncbi:hypothetical protein FH603_5006 [Spirosoma sp. LMG 31447]|uniref:Uncharacterized protein n=1 Tax=Spirosoma utsteinense TaxID=2585773 RepID=A0ABR6WD74_9BACT|nr:hypothetical protein [Spirosoma utsteinense]
MRLARHRRPYTVVRRYDTPGEISLNSCRSVKKVTLEAG